MISQLSFTALEKLINAYLKLDPDSFVHLSPFVGKIAKITLLDLKVDLYIEVDTMGFRLSPSAKEEACTLIEGSCLDLFKLATQQKTQPKLISQHLKISGDLDFGQALYKVLREMDIDWEEYLSQLIGDTLAYQVMQQARSTFNWFKKSFSVIRESVQDYIHEEARFSPSITEVEDFYKAVSQLRDDVERVEQKINFSLKKNA